VQGRDANRDVPHSTERSFVIIYNYAVILFLDYFFDILCKLLKLAYANHNINLTLYTSARRSVLQYAPTHYVYMKFNLATKRCLATRRRISRRQSALGGHP